MRTLRIRFLIAVLLFVVADCVIAGGISVDPASVEFRNRARVFTPRQDVDLVFRANEYVYGAHRFAYATVAVIPESTPLGRVTRAEMDNWLVYGVLIRAPGELSLHDSSSQYRFEFKAPETPGKYKVLIHALPLFRSAPMKSESGFKRLFVPHHYDRRELIEEAARMPSAFTLVATFTVSAQQVVRDETPPVYLRVDGRVPSEARTPGGLRDHPLGFSWYVGPEFRKDKSKILFRYQLAPEDEDVWGAWSAQTEVNYFFLPRGVHQFKVQAKYVDGLTTLESAPASFQFTLARDLVARPSKEALTKAPHGASAAFQPEIAFDQVYAGSKALLVGVWEFEDTTSFAQFDGAKISADLAAMESALKANGFEVFMLKKGRVKREEIAEELTKLVERSQENDRLFVYFSTHGFADPLLPTDGYLATSDCKMREPSSRCLRLNDLETHANRALSGKKVRQVLFAVDSCFSGLGIVRKSAAVPNLSRLAVPQGAFMLTAGMANQLAQIDRQLGMSTFTHYLAEGLKGKADILGNNGVITLTELFLYVQYEVARHTESQQIPMLGRMKGDGEMLFSPRCGTGTCP